MPSFILHLGQQNGLAFERRCAGDPVAFGQHADDFRMRVLADLADQRFAVGVGHPVLRLDANVRVDFLLKLFFERVGAYFHNLVYLSGGLVAAKVKPSADLFNSCRQDGKTDETDWADLN